MSSLRAEGCKALGEIAWEVARDGVLKSSSALCPSLRMFWLARSSIRPAGHSYRTQQADAITAVLPSADRWQHVDLSEGCDGFVRQSRCQ